MWALSDIRKGEVVERGVGLVVDEWDYPLVERTSLVHYVYDVPGEPDAAFIAFGCGSLYNHSNEPSAEVTIDPAERIYTVTALRRIQDGEEITISYGDAAKAEPWG